MTAKMRVIAIELLREDENSQGKHPLPLTLLDQHLSYR
jgi:hypothetical protein